jgi:hypothetical protein
MQSQLWMGALKSAVSAACGLILSLPIVDPQTFNIGSLGGWKHMGIVTLVVVLVAEARFWKDWADAIHVAVTKNPTP